MKNYQLHSPPCNMSGNNGFNYGNDYSYGYGYANQTSSQGGQNYDYTNFGYNTNSNPNPNQEATTYSSPYGQPLINQQPTTHQPAYDPTATLLNNPAAQIGMQFGTQAFSAGQKYVNTNLNRWISMPLLREYFNVTNSFVFQKIISIFFPFAQKNWVRNFKQNVTSGQIEGYMAPRDDVNSTDLYIPIMALVSYIILVGLFMGVNNAFHPEILGMTATSCIMALVIEVFLIKLGCYLLGIGSEIHFLDFLAYCGYKFCILILTLGASIFGKTIKYCVFGYCILAYGFFLIRSLRPVFVPENSNALELNQRRKRINFLLGVVGLELISSYILLK